MRVEGLLCIDSAGFSVQRALIAGMKSFADGGDRTSIDANGLHARRRVVALSQKQVVHTRESDGMPGSLWPLQLSLLNGKGRVCA